jgi:hypothetical protein
VYNIRINLHVSASKSAHILNLGAVWLWIVTLARRFTLAERTTDARLIGGPWASESAWTFRRTEKSIARGMNWSTIFLSSSPWSSHYTDYPSYRNCAVLSKISSVTKNDPAEGTFVVPWRINSFETCQLSFYSLRLLPRIKQSWNHPPYLIYGKGGPCAGRSDEHFGCCEMISIALWVRSCNRNWFAVNGRLWSLVMAPDQ